MRSELDDHLPSAALADLVGLLIGHLDALQILGCGLDLFQEGWAEAPKDLFPLGLTLGDLIQLGFHLRRKILICQHGRWVIRLQQQQAPNCT